MRILVTGAAGFIGSHLVEALLRKGHSVLGIDNFDSYYAPHIKQYNAQQISAARGEVLSLDLSRDDIQPFVREVEVVYHCAAQPGIASGTPFQSYIRNNIEATDKLLQSLNTSSTLQLFVNVATSSIYGAVAVGAEDTAPAPISYYGVSKLAAEQLVMSYFRRYQFPATSLRLFSVYGARERPDKLYPRLILSILDGVTFPLYADSLNHRRSFTFVGDVISAFLKVLDVDRCIGEIINIGTTESITTGEAIETVEQIMGRKCNYIEQPARIGDQKQTAAATAKAESLLSFRATTSFGEGIRSEIEWLKLLPNELRSYYKAGL